MGKRRSSFVASDESDDNRPAKVAKKANSKAPTSKSGAGIDAEGNAFWEISNKRRVVVQKFKGNTFVNLREYYEDSSGEMKPGKKGLMMSIEQYQSFVGLIPSINAALRNEGVAFEDNEDDGVQDPTSKTTKKVVDAKTASTKANIDATSDEDDG
ncbi:transcriptional Coactivator p15-domain-containing protein [Coniella lustricola]|uniref:Transcriptional Coactivator p15-domain-containing protein n=1 Tax=Coniella lustricola TaxID=2025994 RepID=A0A2T3A195_9PEZI|nr:transcriptional Coactivator p15-domain-containing protein [Coniella lustricola]